MKQLTIYALLLSSFFSFSQDRLTGDPITFTKYWIIKAGVNAVDDSRDWKPFDFLNDESSSAFSNPLAIGIEYRFANANSVSLFGSLNKWKANEGIIDGILLTEDRSYSAIDLSYKFYFDHFFLNANWFDLYIEGGLGLYFISEDGPFTERETKLSQNLGFGTIVWFSDSVGFNLQIVNKFSREELYSGNHVQYFAGLTYKLMKKDFDGDGITNKNDLCPSVFGLKQYNGCPDTDGDGVVDSIDSCPNLAGNKALKGCPDADNDGVTDSEDKCPDVAGFPENGGCPIPDPIKETDKQIETKPQIEVDEQPDNKNQIETVSGQPSEVVLKTLNDYAKTILFDYSKSLFKQETYEVLQSITEIIKTYPDAEFIIEGHTDNLGTHITNDRLSKSRANAVRDYLIIKGIDPARLTAIGYGERRPKYSNATKGGRDQNRRVEVKLKK